MSAPDRPPAAASADGLGVGVAIGCSRELGVGAGAGLAAAGAELGSAINMGPADGRLTEKVRLGVLPLVSSSELRWAAR